MTRTRAHNIDSDIRRRGSGTWPSMLALAFVFLGSLSSLGCLFSLPDTAKGKDAATDADGGTSLGAYATAVTRDRPLAYFRYAETQGSVAQDTTGNFAGTFIGAPSLGETSLLGAPGDYAVRYRGEPARMTTRVVLPDGDFSLEVLLRPASLPLAGGSRAGVFCAEAYLVNGFRAGVEANGAFVLWSTQSGGEGEVSTPEGVFAVGSVHHVVMVKRGELGVIYIDGTKRAESRLTIKVPNGELTVGATQSSNYFDGVIDEPAVYGTALPESRIAEHARLANTPR